MNSRGKEIIEFTEFLDISSKLDVRVGEIVEVEEVPKSDKLLKLKVKFGEVEKIAVTNIKPQIEKQFEGGYMELVGKRSPFVMNLKPSKIMGVESEVMIMPFTDSDDNFYFNDIANKTILI